ncbi:MAG: ribbon-helix-helix domain-containing protein [Nitrospinota bacterium]
MIITNTKEVMTVPASKIAVTVDEKVVKQMDRLVREGKYKSRSSVIQDALEDKLKERKRKRLIAELSKLDPNEERHLAEEFIQSDAEQWDEY